VTTLSVYVKATVGSAYRLDDLKIEVSEEAGYIVDFSNGTDLPSGGGGGGDTPSGASGTGTLDDPYNPAGAAAAVKDLTWTSNTEYQKTEKVYVKGKVCKIANNGRFSESGTFGNASFYLSADGTGNGEFYVYRTLYFGGEKYTSGVDIEIGKEVVVYGALMNYQGKTPESVANECQIYSIDGATSGDGGGGGTPSGEMGSGTLADPYTALGAANAVKDLTWTSNTEYQKTEDVYVKGKISRIANNGAYGQSGTYGNASFYISADGQQKDEFQCYRILYLGNQKYTSGRDIAVGDEVIICGKLMNYKGNTPETVSGEAYLHAFVNESGGGGDGDTPGGDTITWAVGSGNQTWAAASHATYGSGFSATSGGMTVAYYKASSTTNPVTANADHIRVYKGSHLSISVAGRTITGVELTCMSNSNDANKPYCYDLKVSDGSTATADKSALKVTWSGNIASFEADTPDGQIRVTQIKVTCK